MNATDRLHALQARLQESGVVDVKFFFSKNDASPTKVVNDVVNVLDAMLNGRTLPFNGVGDSVRA
ncbi:MULTISPECIES: hypothetical protein [Stenotrophomonas]|uniref:hypothetical protein n=1 Tax=Stenotrophomonas TaxID=40323 RepID=UPI00128B7D8B|nr:MULTISPECIES: hypothetical protein [Stenotrophomonas]ELK2666191.1 hypothetical protein [Stenotrophomonas maltophilia]MBH1377765.1 hypothetical protein [Stenotrophomonas maltophilia]MBH1440453.1 hypothetical protein [Stenotrophomonas maltophilia]MBH1559071.1 hypothetical protein [Stenotrophomonas maltophilia]MBN4987269.1 hypothetical protein [Stenotrophomonas maltophilia]